MNPLVNSNTGRVPTDQGDQMTRLFIQSLAIYHNENLPNSIKIAKVGAQFCQTLSKPLQNCPKLLKFGQSGEILPKSGHTATYPTEL